MRGEYIGFAQPGVPATLFFSYKRPGQPHKGLRQGVAVHVPCETMCWAPGQEGTKHPGPDGVGANAPWPAAMSCWATYPTAVSATGHGRPMFTSRAGAGATVATASKAITDEFVRGPNDQGVVTTSAATSALGPGAIVGAANVLYMRAPAVAATGCRGQEVNCAPRAGAAVPAGINKAGSLGVAPGTDVYSRLHGPPPKATGRAGPPYCRSDI